MTNTHELRREAEALKDEAVRIRRDLHSHPELGFQEHRTSEIVARYLSDLGLHVETGIAKTGVVGLLHGREDGPTLLVRADMDALPVDELNDVPYRSRHKGIMHACGHDGHTTIGLIVAKLLSARRSELKGTVKFVFQPAEELLGGAQAMIDAGVLESPYVDAVIGLHLWSTNPVGTISTKPNEFMAAADTLFIRIVGKGGHAAMPNKTVDSIYVASQIVTALQSVVSRNVSPLDSAVVSFGTIQGGTALNVIPEVVTLSGTIRTFRNSVRAQVHERLESLVKGIASAHGAEADVTIHKVCAPTINDGQMTELVLETARSMLGEEAVHTTNGTMGAEDISFFLRERPGCFFYVGAQPSNGRVYPHHSPYFDFDESALPLGAALMSACVLRYLEQGGIA